MNGSIDELELELRRLPGVEATGFEIDGDVTVVHLEVAGPDQPPPATEAARIAAHHSRGPIAVAIRRHRPGPTARPPEPTIELPTERGPAGLAPVPPPGATAEEPRVRLLSVLSFPDTNEIEVHLVDGEQRTIGRCVASDGVVGATTATIGAIAELRPDLDMAVRWARELETGDDDASIVAVSIVADSRSTGRVRCYGLAGSHGPLDAAARATLDALNRQLSRRA